MFEPESVLLLDSMICMIYGGLMMMTPEFLTNMYLKVAHTSSIQMLANLWGASLLGMGMGLYWVIDLGNKKGINMALKMRA